MPSGAAGKADLSRLDSPAASPAERLASARRLIARSEQFLDSLAPMGRAELARLVLEGQNADFPGRRAWEEKLLQRRSTMFRMAANSSVKLKNF